MVKRTTVNELIEELLLLREEGHGDSEIGLFPHLDMRPESADVHSAPDVYELNFDDHVYNIVEIDSPGEPEEKFILLKFLPADMVEEDEELEPLLDDSKGSGTDREDEEDEV